MMRSLQLLCSCECNVVSEHRVCVFKSVRVTHASYLNVVSQKNTLLYMQCGVALTSCRCMLAYAM